MLISLLLSYKLIFSVLVCLYSHYKNEYLLFYSALCVFPGVLVSGYIADNVGVAIVLYLSASHMISDSRRAKSRSKGVA